MANATDLTFEMATMELWEMIRVPLIPYYIIMLDSGAEQATFHWGWLHHNKNEEYI